MIDFSDAFINDRLNEVTNFALTAIESFANKNLDEKCRNSGEFSCRFRRMFNDIDKQYPYER